MDERPVAIENQYGITDHKHLGQLVTYLAQQGGGLGLRVVEDYSEAHLAAMEFLNRTSTSGIGYMLVRVRFTHGVGPSVYQVHFEVAARPNDFVRSGRRRRGAAARPLGASTSLTATTLRLIFDVARPELERIGYRGISLHARGSYITVRLPASLDVSNWGGPDDQRDPRCKPRFDSI